MPKGCDIANQNWADEEILPTPLSEKEKDEIEKAVEAAKKSDVAVVFLGDQTTAFERLEPLTVGESSSRTSLDLPGRQLDLVKAVYAVGKPVIVVLINGRPMSINWVNKFVPGIIETWFRADTAAQLSPMFYLEIIPKRKINQHFSKICGTNSV